MATVHIELPDDLANAVQLDRREPSADTARLLALLLFREDKISLGKAAELSRTPIEAFMEFAGRHGVPLHYGVEDLEEDRCSMTRIGL